MSADIVDRLRTRREFYSPDPGRWYMSVDPDSDCAEAADEIERLRHALAISREIRAAWAKLSMPEPDTLSIEAFVTRLRASQKPLEPELRAMLGNPFNLYESEERPPEALKWCTYCRKANHSDSECTCTRAVPARALDEFDEAAVRRIVREELAWSRPSASGSPLNARSD